MPKIDKQKLLKSIQINNLHPPNKKLEINLTNLELRLGGSFPIHKIINNIHLHINNKLQKIHFIQNKQNPLITAFTYNNEAYLQFIVIIYNDIE